MLWRSCVRFMTSLKDINLGYNRLETFPNNLHRLVELRNLDLRHNKLHHMPNVRTQVT